MRYVAIPHFISEQRAATATTVPKMRRRYVARAHRADRQAWLRSTDVWMSAMRTFRNDDGQVQL